MHLFKKVKANFHPTTYHKIYRYDGLVVFTGKSNAKEVKIGLKVSATLNKAERNQHLQFTAEIWMTKKNSPTPAKEEIVQIVTNNKFPFLELKMIWSPEGDLQFSVFRKQGHQLKYVGK